MPLTLPAVTVVPGALEASRQCRRRFLFTIALDPSELQVPTLVFQKAVAKGTSTSAALLSLLTRFSWLYIGSYD